jgi:hypothetical protein
MAKLISTAGNRAREVRPRAVLRLRGLGDVPASALLEAVEQVRRALGTLGISEVSIEVVPEEPQATPPDAILVS